MRVRRSVEDGYLRPKDSPYEIVLSPQAERFLAELNRRLKVEAIRAYGRLRRECGSAPRVRIRARGRRCSGRPRGRRQRARQHIRRRRP